jgi:hypothetical protein
MRHTLSHTLTVLSQPAVHRRLTGAEGGCEATMLPAGTAGAQDTAVTPMTCALGICTGGHRAGKGQEKGGQGSVCRFGAVGGPASLSLQCAAHCSSPLPAAARELQAALSGHAARR